MWSRFRRRSMAPRRPLLFPDQVPLAVVTGLFVVLGVVGVIVALVLRG